MERRLEGPSVRLCAAEAPSSPTYTASSAPSSLQGTDEAPSLTPARECDWAQASSSYREKGPPSVQVMDATPSRRISFLRTPSRSLLSTPSRSSVHAARPPGYVRVGGRLPVRVLRSAEELTPEWLTEVFRWRGYLEPAGRVLSLRQRRLGEGQGAFGDLQLIHAEYDGAREHAPSCFVAKFSPQKAVDVPRVAVRAAFTNEAHFYNDFAVEDGGLARPECYACLAQLPITGDFRFLFLLEFLGASDRPAMLQPREPPNR